MRETCWECEGTGECPVCEGEGCEECADSDGDCLECDGRGYVEVE